MCTERLSDPFSHLTPIHLALMYAGRSPGRAKYISDQGQTRIVMVHVMFAISKASQGEVRQGGSSMQVWADRVFAVAHIATSRFKDKLHCHSRGFPGLRDRGSYTRRHVIPLGASASQLEDVNSACKRATSRSASKKHCPDMSFLLSTHSTLRTPTPRSAASSTSMLEPSGTTMTFTYTPGACCSVGVCAQPSRFSAVVIACTMST